MNYKVLLLATLVLGLAVVPSATAMAEDTLDSEDAQIYCRPETVDRYVCHPIRQACESIFDPCPVQ